MEARSRVISSFTIVKGSLIEETYSVFRDWDYSVSKFENLRHVRDDNSIGATSTNWALNVTKVMNRRFDPEGRDRPLVELAKAGCERELWKPLLLYHMTRDEFLVRDFLVNWLFPQFRAGAYRLRTDDVFPYLNGLQKMSGIDWSGSWSDSTLKRVGSGLLRIATDFGLLQGSQIREFASYHLPDESFLYLLHAMVEREANARRVIDAEDWHLFLMGAEDVERALLRLHQFRRIDYEVAGSLAQIKLPAASAADFARELH
ncbi:BrxA family protein [Lamprobacter modestohalophilus]|uniref:BrxA family protein n=1 Tax=Lamprobacter modestohalophilus TaxID=1064514 RepID=UPI002ADEB681|nr:BrxA family protein [Lamprobacter modestohalophilus]MEA1050839.1 BrxA family protein [Lamprobacter modestohalophilus]